MLGIIIVIIVIDILIEIYNNSEKVKTLKEMRKLGYTDKPEILDEVESNLNDRNRDRLGHLQEVDIESVDLKAAKTIIWNGKKGGGVVDVEYKDT